MTGQPGSSSEFDKPTMKNIILAIFLCLPIFAQAQQNVTAVSSGTGQGNLNTPSNFFTTAKNVSSMAAALSGSFGQGTITRVIGTGTVGTLTLTGNATSGTATVTLGGSLPSGGVTSGTSTDPNSTLTASGTLMTFSATNSPTYSEVTTPVIVSGAGLSLSDVSGSVITLDAAGDLTIAGSGGTLSLADGLGDNILLNGTTQITDVVGSLLELDGENNASLQAAGGELDLGNGTSGISINSDGGIVFNANGPISTEGDFLINFPSSDGTLSLTSDLPFVLTGTLVGGTATVHDSRMTANVIPVDTGASITNLGSLQVNVSGTNATVRSSNVLDTSTFSLYVLRTLSP